MTMVLDTQAALPVAARRASARLGAAVDTLEDVIAAHRMALLDLAPCQDERAARGEAAWHMEHLGLLLSLRDRWALGTVRLGAVLMGDAGAAPTHAERRTRGAKESAAPGPMEGRERQWEDAGTDRLTH